MDRENVQHHARNTEEDIKDLLGHPTARDSLATRERRTAGGGRSPSPAALQMLEGATPVGDCADSAVSEARAGFASMTQGELDRLITAAMRGARRATTNRLLLEEAADIAILKLVQASRGETSIRCREAWCYQAAQREATSLARREKKLDSILRATFSATTNCRTGARPAPGLEKPRHEDLAPFYAELHARLPRRCQDALSATLQAGSSRAACDICGMPARNFARAFRHIIRVARSVAGALNS